MVQGEAPHRNTWKRDIVQIGKDNMVCSKSPLDAYAYGEVLMEKGRLLPSPFTLPAKELLGNSLHRYPGEMETFPSLGI